MKRTPLKRKTPLRTFTPLRAKKPLTRTEFKKKRLTKKLRKRARSVDGRYSKVWSTSRADQTFSMYIRLRDGKCMSCGNEENLTCSHFWRRGHSATRFDPINCVALCWSCHQVWEDKKEDEYKAFMLSRLGEQAYIQLEKRAQSYMSRVEAVSKWKEFYTWEKGKHHAIQLVDEELKS